MGTMTTQLTLLRVEEGDSGTFGVLLIDGEFFCVTLEPPDRDNRECISNIPPGHYECRKVNSPKYGETYEIANVTNRTHILFHAGNTVKHTKGCVLLGKEVGSLRGDRAILNSGATFRRFLYLMDGASKVRLSIVVIKV